jgi:tRNA(Ile)-lysidine synthase
MAGADRLTALAADLDRRVDIGDEPVAVALSGGADSAALLWLVCQRQIDVTAIHVIHGLPASALMSTAAGQIAARCGVALEMAVVAPAGTSEHQLRDARLDALEQRAGDRPVLLAHTADDQAETVLMRALRGTGVDGLAGIRPVRGAIHHPMLDITRAETRELATLAGLPFRDDPSNEDDSILRNRIRRDVFPAAEAAVGHSPRDSLIRLATIAAEESALGDRLAATVPVQCKPGVSRVPLGALVAQHDAVVARVLRRAARAVTDRYPPGRDALDRVLEVVRGDSRGAEIEGGISVYRADAHLYFATAPGETTPLEMTLSATAAWGDWRFEVNDIRGPAAAPQTPFRLVAPEDFAPLTVRAAIRGDRLTGRKITDALADVGVRAEDRPGWPVVSAGDEVVWVPGVRSRVWPTHRPGRYLGVLAVQEPSWQIFEP